MKKITITSAVIIGMLLFNSGQVKAQNREGQVVINAGLGFSIIGTAFDVIVDQGTASHATSPVMNVTVDYALINKFSIGIGIAYQTLEYYDDDNGPGYSNQVSRLNIGIRPLYHFTLHKKTDIYTGARFGISKWYLPNDNFLYPSGLIGSSGVVPSFQALFGVRKYFSNHVGAHIELALGTPYFMEAGISFKFGGKQMAAKKL